MRGKYLKRKVNNLKKWVSERPYYIRRYVDRKLIRRRDFTIISNNCWAGKVYQYLDMPYLSPTVGLYFFANDYIKFVSDLRYYLSLDLEFIKVEESKYYDILCKRNQTNVPIGRLDDLEIVFLHYQSEKEAKDKWNRRKERVNYHNVHIKFSNMNNCSDNEMKKFDSLNFKNKFMLNNKKRKKYKCELYWNGPSNDVEILSDTVNFPGNIQLVAVLNKKAEHLK